MCTASHARCFVNVPNIRLCAANSGVIVFSRVRAGVGGSGYTPKKGRYVMGVGQASDGFWEYVPPGCSIQANNNVWPSTSGDCEVFAPPGKGRRFLYIGDTRTASGAKQPYSIHLAEVEVFTANGEKLKPVKASLSSDHGPEHAASVCFDGSKATGKYCQTHSDDEDPYLLADFGHGGSRIAKIVVTNRHDSTTNQGRITDATISLGPQGDGSYAAWSAKFSGSRTSYTFNIPAAHKTFGSATQSSIGHAVNASDLRAVFSPGARAHHTHSLCLSVSVSPSLSLSLLPSRSVARSLFLSLSLCLSLCLSLSLSVCLSLSLSLSLSTNTHATVCSPSFTTLWI